jgi:hypothetical protein
MLSLRLVSPGSGNRFYGLVEGGLYTSRINIKGTYTIGSQVTNVNISEFRSEPAIIFGGGILFPLNKELSLDVNIRYHWIRDSQYLSYGSGNSIANSKLLSLGIGANWFFLLNGE